MQNTSQRTKVIIPALNEEASIGLVLDALPRNLIQEVVVVDNGSSDQTTTVAASKDATVLREDRRGYGAACLKGLHYISNQSPLPDIIVFLDADFSDNPNELPLILTPILNNEADLVIGSRVTGKAEKGSLMPQQRFGNALATFLIRLIYGVRYTDLGPFRAIRFSALQALNMQDRNFGWTVEMQIKAAAVGLRITEVPVSYKRRIGQSKVSGTIRGSVMAGYKIIATIFRYAF
ncbi:MAG: glycosyltransferase family 2 protein [Flavobacteriales bacterium]|nr:glycosyltransferase family 2 protein [Flavobacteriales bacterium]